MPAQEHLNNYLFGELFEQMHGITIDDALSGNKVKMMGIDNKRNPGSQWFTPEEHDEVFKQFSNPKLKERGERGWREIHKELTAPTDPEQTIRKYQTVNPVSMFVSHGNPYQNAAQLRDLTSHLRNSSRPNEVKLYRGAKRPPNVDAGRDRPLGFTPDHYAARTYALTGKVGERTPIFKADIGTVRGVPLREVGGNSMYVSKQARRRDNEWLVLPESIPEKWPEKKK